MAVRGCIFCGFQFRYHGSPEGTEPMNKPTEFGPFWNDIQWFDITESGTPASEVLSKFPGNYWLEKNENEMRIYKDKEKTQCLQQFKRLI